MATEKKPTPKKINSKKTKKEETPKKVDSEKVEKKEVKFCQHCGAKMPKEAEACMKCGKFTAEHKAPQSATGDTKIFKILSYLGILWLIGMLGDKKDDKEVRFHVGQGMLITIIWVAVALINNLIIANVFVTTKTYWYYTYKTTSGLGYALMWIFWLVPSILSIIGLVNALKNEEKELPVIGKFAFYK